MSFVPLLMEHCLFALHGHRSHLHHHIHRHSLNQWFRRDRQRHYLVVAQLVLLVEHRHCSKSLTIIQENASKLDKFLFDFLVTKSIFFTIF